MSESDENRRRLLGAKLAGIVRHRGGTAVGVPQAIQGGAGLLGPDGQAWVLVQDQPERGVGLASAWALRRGAARPTLVVDVDRDGAPQPEAAAVAARKGAALARPVPVWVVRGTEVGDAEPAPHPPAPPYEPSPETESWRAAAAAAGLDVVVHADGSATAEVLGLEVARFGADGSAAIGAGKHDREATAELYGGEPTREALVRAAETVRQSRRGGEQPGPANALQRERWLRLALLADPSPLGLGDVRLEPVADPTPPLDLRRLRPAAAVTVAGDVLVVCSAGADLDLVPTAADLLAWAAPGAQRAILAVPARDVLPITLDLAATLMPVPTEVVGVPAPWEDR